MVVSRRPAVALALVLFLAASNSALCLTWPAEPASAATCCHDETCAAASRNAGTGEVPAMPLSSPHSLACCTTGPSPAPPPAVFAVTPDSTASVTTAAVPWFAPQLVAAPALALPPFARIAPHLLPTVLRV